MKYNTMAGTKYSALGKDCVKFAEESQTKEQMEALGERLKGLKSVKRLLC